MRIHADQATLNHRKKPEISPSLVSPGFRVSRAKSSGPVDSKLPDRMARRDREDNTDLVSLHDGGLAVDIKTNATNSMCTSKAAYSESPEYVFRGTAMGTDKVAKDHISSMSGCNTESWTVDEVRRDQSWFVEGKYDYDAREGNKENGKQSDIMAVSMVVVAVEPGKFLRM